MIFDHHDIDIWGEACYVVTPIMYLFDENKAKEICANHQHVDISLPDEYMISSYGYDF